MRKSRLILILLALYFMFIGGTSRYQTIYQIRVAHHVIVTVVLGLWLINRLRHKKGLPSSPLDIPLYGAVMTWFITALTSLDQRMAFEHLWFPLTYILMFFIVLDYFQRGRSKVIMEAFFMMATMLVFITSIELASWYFGLGIVPGTEVGWFTLGILLPPSLPQVSMAMGISTLLAGLTVPLIMVSITWALTVRLRDYSYVLWILAIALIGVLILTFSRGGLLALSVGIACFALFRLMQAPAILSRFSQRLVLVSGLGLVLVSALLLVGLVLPFSRGQSDEGRSDMWQSALQMTIEHPLTGVGAGLFGRAFRDYRNPNIARDKLAAAHNAYLNLASENGLLGILVGAGLLFFLLKSTYHTWQNARGRNQKIRVEGMFAALIALAVHSLVDVFTITPINLVLIVIVAYLVTGHRRILDPLAEGKQLPAWIALAIILVYGGILLQWDRAQGLYQASFGQYNQEGLNLTEQAREIDPHLHLYDLHKAFILGNMARDETSITQAITAYEYALELEPTWDIGWINLAELELRLNQPEIALSHLEQAIHINPLTSATLHWARIAEQYQLADESAISNAYLRALRTEPYLPLSDFWWETPLRIEATETYVNKLSLEQQYRVYRIHQAEKAQTLVSDSPQSAQEWWIIGQDIVDSDRNTQEAERAFTQAISINPTQGDYYVSRAFSRLNSPELAQNDLLLARLYGTKYEYPNRVKALLATDKQEAIKLKATALPIYSSPQEFAAVLFTRPALFDPMPAMRFPGLGRDALSPWYDVAYYFVEQGQTENAIRAFRFILENAPYETEAQEQVMSLVDAS